MVGAVGIRHVSVCSVLIVYGHMVCMIWRCVDVGLLSGGGMRGAGGVIGCKLFTVTVSNEKMKK